MGVLDSYFSRFTPKKVEDILNGIARNEDLPISRRKDAEVFARVIRLPELEREAAEAVMRHLGSECLVADIQTCPGCKREYFGVNFICDDFASVLKEAGYSPVGSTEE
jgi:hypothetical protein